MLLALFLADPSYSVNPHPALGGTTVDARSRLVDGPVGPPVLMQSIRLYALADYD